MRPIPIRLLRIFCATVAIGTFTASGGVGNGGPVPAPPDSQIGTATPKAGEGIDTSGAVPVVGVDADLTSESADTSEAGESAPAPTEADLTTESADTSEAGESAPTPEAMPAVPPEPAIASVPFGPGERLDYRVTVGLFGGVGRGSMEVPSVDTVRGHPCYRLRMSVQGGVPFAHVDDRLQSWMDVSTLSSRRFEQDQKEPNWKRHRIWNFFPEQKSWATEEPNAVGTLPTDSPLDDVSFLYYVRTLPLTVGETYSLDRYFRADGNPVIIKVLRVEIVSVPLGKFETIVVRPIIRTRGLFGQGGEAEVYFSNDTRRIPVMMRSKIPILGHLNLYLERHVPGKPICEEPLDPVRDE